MSAQFSSGLVQTVGHRRINDLVTEVDERTPSTVGSTTSDNSIGLPVIRSSCFTISARWASVSALAVVTIARLRSAISAATCKYPSITCSKVLSEATTARRANTRVSSLTWPPTNFMSNSWRSATERLGSPSATCSAACPRTSRLTWNNSSATASKRSACRAPRSTARTPCRSRARVSAAGDRHLQVVVASRSSLQSGETFDVKTASISP